MHVTCAPLSLASPAPLRVQQNVLPMLYKNSARQRLLNLRAASHPGTDAAALVSARHTRSSILLPGDNRCGHPLTVVAYPVKSKVRFQKALKVIEPLPVRGSRTVTNEIAGPDGKTF